MKKALLILLLSAFATSALAQKPRPQTFSTEVDSLQTLIYERTSVKVKFSLSKVMLIGNTLDFYFTKDLGCVPWRPADIRWFKDTFVSLSNRKMKGYKMGIVMAGRQNLEELVMPEITSNGKPAETTLRIPAPTNTALVRKGDNYPQGLSGRHIALWQSHGLYYKADAARWSYQRSATHSTLEDVYTQSYVLPFLIPMLENAGAVVMTPRERDPQVYEVVCDNDPAFPGERTGLLRRSGTYTELGTWKDAGQGFADAQEYYLDHDNPFTMGTARKTSVSNAQGAKGFSATWRPDIPESGDYAVYVSYKTLPESTTDAQYTVVHKGGKTLCHVNQTMGGGTWIYLGTYPFNKGTSGYVTLSNQSQGRGVVTADAVRFGGGMGKDDRGIGISGMPAYVEGALGSMQYAGMPMEQFDDWDTDYTKDYAGRGRWVKEMVNRGIPFDCSLAFHTDAGVTPDSTTIGTLAIYTYKSEEGYKYADGTSRMNGRLLTDFVQTQVVNDIRDQFDPEWSRRQIWDRSYSESRTTGVPGVLLELLSHQNFSDMRYGLDPTFRFTVCRSVYKAILKFLSARYGVNYVVQPLPVHGFKARLEGKEAVLSWEPTTDAQEPTAKPTGYLVYTRIDDGAFGAGKSVSSASYRVTMNPGHVYSFKVEAVNKGGRSFPSEVLAVGIPSSDNAKKVTVVNNFTRVSAPSWFDTPTYAGFTHDLDSGVPWGQDLLFCGPVNQFRRNATWNSDDDPGHGGSYTDMAGSKVAGNTFDFVARHGRAILDAGYAFDSSSAEAWDGKSDCFAVDIICGKQITTRVGNGAIPDRYQVFTPSIQKAIKAYTATGGNVIISGSYIATDAWDTIYPGIDRAPEATRSFIRDILGYKSVTNYGDRTGTVLASFGTNLPDVTYNRDYSPDIYRIENPDGISPSNPDFGKYIMKYKGSGIGAAVLSQGKGGYKVAAFGFPLETCSDIDGVLKATLGLF